jgi:hypothetical protein
MPFRPTDVILRGMANALTVTLEILPEGESFTGRATVESGDSTQFAGWLGLVAALDALLRDAPPDDEAPRNLTVT